MTSRRILGLASAANEAVIAYRDDIDRSDWINAGESAHKMAGAVDALTGAIAEEANDPERKCEHGYGIKQGPCPICDAS